MQVVKLEREHLIVRWIVLQFARSCCKRRSEVKLREEKILHISVGVKKCLSWDKNLAQLMAYSFSYLVNHLIKQVSK